MIMKWFLPCIWGFFALAALPAFSHPVYAGEEPTADQVQVSTPVYRPEFSQFDPPLGTYSYTVSWQGIPAASAELSVAQDDMYYRIVASARTYSGVDLFYRLRYRAEGLISSYDLSPVKTIIDQSENSRIKNTQITFGPDDSVFAVRSSQPKNEVKVLNFKPNNFMLDPFSAAFLARSLPWEKGETKQFDCFNGKSRYLVSLTAEDRVTMMVNNQSRDVWVIVPKVINLTSQEQTKKLRRAKIYVTADKAREVLQIVSEVFIGSVTTKLASFIPAEQAAPAVRVARSRAQDSFMR